MASKLYKVGWICALPTELAAATCMLDTIHESLPQAENDSNSYILGSIGTHNVVVTCLPAGVMGQTSAGRVASQLQSTFPALRFVLMVGIGGGIPSYRHDLRLGDIVVSKPDADSGGVIQFDYGKTVKDGRFMRTGSLNRPPDVLLNAVANLQAQHLLRGPQIQSILSQTAVQYPRRAEACQGFCEDCDQLFDWSYDHQGTDPDCFDCNRDRLVARSHRRTAGPFIHYGLIASGNQVMRHGGTREMLRKQFDVLCVEMEAAALMDNFQCLVIRGICDYADSHKNKDWQDYAALSAAAYAKELLNIMPGEAALVPSAVTFNQVGQVGVEIQQLTEFALSALASNPWDVLSLAASISQITDFMSRIIAQARQGSSDDRDLARVEVKEQRDAFYLGNKIEHLSWLSTILRHKKLVVPENGLSRATMTLNNIADDCIRQSHVFASLCRRVARDYGHSHTYSTLGKAFREACQQQQLPEMALQLVQYEADLYKSLLRLLQETGFFQGSIVTEILSINLTLKRATADGDLDTSRLQNRVVTVILRSTDGSFRTVDDPDPSSDIPRSDSSAAFLEYHTIVYGCFPAEDDESVVQSLDEPQYQRRQMQAKVIRKDGNLAAAVLDILYFRALPERVGVVSSPHRSTFDWIFEENTSRNAAWSNLVEWLKGDSGCYWINGKAGSGKSTLAKHIWKHDRLRSCLQKWASSDQLLMASFFFWAAGTPLQQTQEGLLRALLFTILEQKRDIIPHTMPALCFQLAANDSALGGDAGASIPLSQLKIGLSKLLLQGIPRAKIFLLIDGLDEYRGAKHEAAELELSQLLMTGAQTDHVKILICSRDVPACYEVFQRCPQLRLQELTATDIARVVRDDLSNTESLRDMDNLKPGLQNELIQAITKRAQGVFLWVRLVIKELLTGLINYDTPEELMQILNKLPTDLKDLYKVMLGRMRPEHQRTAAMMLRLMGRSLEMQHLVPLSLLQFCHAMDDEPFDSVALKVEEIHPIFEQRRCKVMEGRIRSRCMGLLEVQGREFPSVGFLHRTVFEFLRTDYIEQDLLGLTKDLDYDFDELLLGSCLSVMKEKSIAIQDMSTYLVACMSYLATMETRMQQPQTIFWDAICEFMAGHTNNTVDFKTLMDGQLEGWALRAARHLGFVDLKLRCPDPTFALLLVSGLSYTAAEYLTERMIDADNLAYFVFEWIVFIITSWHVDSLLGSTTVLRNLDLLLDAGADPNTRLHLENANSDAGRLVRLRGAPDVMVSDNSGISAWEWLVAVLAKTHTLKWKQEQLRFRLPTLLQVVQRFLDHGAVTTRLQSKALRGTFLFWVRAKLPKLTTTIDQIEASLPSVPRSNLVPPMPKTEVRPSSTPPAPRSDLNSTLQRSASQNMKYVDRSNLSVSNLSETRNSVEFNPTHSCTSQPQTCKCDLKDDDASRKGANQAQSRRWLRLGRLRP